MNMRHELLKARQRASYHSLERIHIKNEELAAELALTNPDHARLRWIRRRVRMQSLNFVQWEGFVNVLGDVYRVTGVRGQVAPKDWTLT